MNGAQVFFDLDNQSGVSPVSAVLSGQRLAEDCLTRSTTLATSYSTTVQCTGTGPLTCAAISGLAPGSWRHSITVLSPASTQYQHQPTLVLAGGTPNRVHFTIFATVMAVTSTANSGPGTLRNALHTTEVAAKPVLVQFDPATFPDGVPTRITLSFELPVLTADRVTIDGTDATGAGGNRIIDAAGLPIPALAISGGGNHIVGLRLTGAGGNNRDTLGISGPNARGNLVERSIITAAATGDGIGIDHGAGADFRVTANVIRDCEISGASDKGIKVTTGSHARVLRSWVHDNANGGIQATLAGHVQAWQNLVEANAGATAENGLSAAGDQSGSGDSELQSWANISRGNGANGISVRGSSFAVLHDDYLAANGTSGVRVINDVGPPAAAVVSGTSAVCNGLSGAVVADTSVADFGGGPLGGPGNNAFAANGPPASGANLRNTTGLMMGAVNNQWEHCGSAAACDTAAIAAFDLSDHGATTTFLPAQAPAALPAPSVEMVAPDAGRRGELLHVFGSGFNAIDGVAQDGCANPAGANGCTPLHGTCVLIGGIPAVIEAVTPTMVAVRWPFTCLEPVPLVVRTQSGTSAPHTVCTNDAGGEP